MTFILFTQACHPPKQHACHPQTTEHLHGLIHCTLPVESVRTRNLSGLTLVKLPNRHANLTGVRFFPATRKQNAGAALVAAL
jgi:hypothetical protein